MITKEIITSHGLSDEEYQKILEILGREPNLVELGIFSVMWSEHCSYKSSKTHLKNFPTTGVCVVEGPGENAGVIYIGEGIGVVFKMESHNHPSFIEPYQGAATGVGGILRDVFTMGARPVANLNSLRFGSLEDAKQRYLLNGVVAGIAGYGNCMGVPTVGGEVYFNDCYKGNILVNAMTVGLVRVDKIFKGNASGVGNPVIYVGSKTGRDGIHGATMASAEFGEGSEEKRPTVQVGDPFTEKLLLEACLEVFKTDYVVGIQDMGAAGLTSSSFEMASRAGTGIEMVLDDVPMREEGMTPYEIMLSESQERMLLVARKGTEDKVVEIFKKWDLDAVVVGSVTNDGFMRIKMGGETVAELPVKPLAEGAPVYERPIEEPEYQKELQNLDLKSIKEPADYNQVLLRLLDSPTIASKKWIYRQYDHMVRTNTVVLPGSDAAVIRVKGTKMGLAMTTDCNSRYCYLDPYTGGMITVAEAARNIVCSGGKPMALTDCLNFGNPEKPEIMWQLEQAILGMSEACEKLKTPVIGGNVSLYNETQGVAIHPTPTIGMVGLLDDVSQHCTSWFKDEGDAIILIGRNKEELGGSEYLKVIHGLEKGMPPSLDLDIEKAVHDICLTGIRDGLIKSAHDCSEGGIAVALAECCFTAEEHRIGAKVDLSVEIRKDALLFGESQSRIVVTVSQNKLPEFMMVAANYHTLSVKVIGKVGGDRLVINDLVNLPVSEMEKAWEEAIPRRLERL